MKATLNKRIYITSLVIALVMQTGEAKQNRSQARSACHEVACSNKKLKEGYVQVPERTDANGTVIPAAKLFYREQGKSKKDAPTLFFIHGDGFSSFTWSCQLTELSKKYRTIAIDLRGFGCSEKSDPLTTQYTFELFANDIHVVLQKLCVKNPIMIGHSIGGSITLLYNELYPGELKKMALIDTNPFLLVPDSFTQPGCDSNCSSEVVPTSPTCWPYPTFTQTQFAGLLALIQQIGYEAALQNVFAPTFYNEACTEELVNAKNSLVQTGLQEGGPVRVNVGLNLGVDLRTLLPKITIPTLVALGTIDQVVPPAAGLFIYSQVPGAWLATCDKKGHLPHVTDYKRFNRVLEEFVTGAAEECCVCPLVKPTGPCKKI